MFDATFGDALGGQYTVAGRCKNTQETDRVTGWAGLQPSYRIRISVIWFLLGFACRWVIARCESARASWCGVLPVRPNAHLWSLAFSGSMCQIQLPLRGLSKARAPRGAMTKIESKVHIVVAISYSCPHVLVRSLAALR